MANAIAVRAPADVSKDDIWKKCVSLSKKIAKDKTEELALTEKFMDNGTIAVTAVGAGYLFTKFPKLEQIGPVPVQPVVGILALLYGTFTTGWVSDRAENVGIGLLSPWLFEKGAELALPA